MYIKKTLSVKPEELLPNVSVDCVIFGFHEGILKVLLNRFSTHDQWMLPGGFVGIDENVDDAAYRLLTERTNLKKIYLTQFYLFGDRQRTNLQKNIDMLMQIGYSEEDAKSHWFSKRFVSVAYYALVDSFAIKTKSSPDDKTAWFDVNEIPRLYSDHNQIIDKAISVIRIQLGYIPIGYRLLPEKFTMSELRIIYETILGKPIDRRNFQRRMLNTGLVVPLNEVSKKFGVKETSLFSFNKKKYADLMKDGSLFI